MKLDEIKTCVRCGGAYKLPDMFSRHPYRANGERKEKVSG